MITIQNLTCLSTIEHRCRGLVLVASLGISIMASRQRGTIRRGYSRVPRGRRWPASLIRKPSCPWPSARMGGCWPSLPSKALSSQRGDPRKSLTTSARISPSTSPRRSGNSTCPTNHTVRPVRTSLDPKTTWEVSPRRSFTPERT